MNRRVLFLFVVLATLPAFAGETDQHYTWRRRLPDSAPTYNAFVNAHFAAELRGVNRLPWAGGLSCDDVAYDLIDGLLWKEYRFFVGSHHSDGLSWAPRRSNERHDEYARYGLYRHAPFWSPAFSIIPLDATIRFGATYVGTDKLAHFYPNGWRYYVRYRDALADGATRDEAVGAAIDLGIEQERGLFGLAFGTFSYADLEANESGLRWLLSLCHDDEPQLYRDPDDGRWRLRDAFDITEWVTPCWDESFYGNAYHPDAWPFVKQGLLEYCPMRDFPEVEARFEAYRERGCESHTRARLPALIERGEIPDPAPHSMDAVCPVVGAEP